LLRLWLGPRAPGGAHGALGGASGGARGASGGARCAGELGAELVAGNAWRRHSALVKMKRKSRMKRETLGSADFLEPARYGSIGDILFCGTALLRFISSKRVKRGTVVCSTILWNQMLH
jgi:hypothetical protein